MRNNLEDIFYQSGVRYYPDNLKFLIQNAISDLFYSKFELLRLININHLDRAVFKYREASECKKIYNTKNYFTACLKSAIKELSIDE